MRRHTPGIWDTTAWGQIEAEGWSVFTLDDGSLAIQKLDDMDLFEYDEQAIGFVKDRAAEGPEIHQQALAAVIASRCKGGSR